MEEFDMTPDDLMEQDSDGIITVKCKVCGELGVAEPDADTAYCEGCGKVRPVWNPMIEILGVSLW